ncbi:unnamed protein product [Brassica oleracea]
MDYRNWLYDVFPSFSGEDVRINFLSHFLKELDRKLIKAFKDNEIERRHSIAPALVTAIRTSLCSRQSMPLPVGVWTSWLRS